MKIGVDLDDILSTSYLPLISWHNRFYKTELTEADLTTAHLESLFGCEITELLSRMRNFYQSEEYYNIQPILDALLPLRTLARTHELFIITSRPYYVQAQTEQWLERYFPNLFTGIYFANPYLADAPERRSKATICAQSQISIMIDDNLDLLTACNDSCDHLILFDKTWNQGTVPPKITRLKTWQEVETHLAFLTHD